jgi:hypothetical protein
MTTSSASSHSTNDGEEARAIPLTLIDLVGTLVAALVPALIGGLFIVARRHSLRKREQIEWSNQVELTLEEEWLDDQGEEDSHTREQEEQFNGTEDETLQQLLSHASVTNESAHSRLSRLKCRLRSLQESPPPQ